MTKNKQDIHYLRGSSISERLQISQNISELIRYQYSETHLNQFVSDSYLK
jgi:hypothetical protein